MKLNWIKNGTEYIGPFDTERDARIVIKVLQRMVDYIDWELVIEGGV